MHSIKLTERNGNDLVLEVTDSESVDLIVEVTLFDDGNFNARVGSHHVSEEVRNDINHFLAEQNIRHKQEG
ncbi:hypothetical protein [Sphingobacterium bambusae]|uniref:Uncharacterized protein n=1 Tax=Sphingobacterium bambusae TaxID=662858 RepID=A0ABW6BGB8_9SPHI|nr:hypothetical protein [Sphingobacterium bambusae]WPL49729.1 hypothetical protein SCB77_04590 [Sphingobacterium bambusae]